MCGIFALLNNNKTYSDEIIENSFMKGKNRGPEYTKYLYKENIDLNLGFHRLSINGLDENSNQPFKMDNITLICNGEIYNHNELFKELNIERKTNSDCEIILHLYKLYGINQTLHLLDGVFSFVLLDESDYIEGNKLYVARDPFGVRPLYVMEFECENNMNMKINKLAKSKPNTIIGFASEPNMLIDLHNYKNPKFQSVMLAKKSVIHQFTPGTYSKYVRDWKCHSRWEIKTENRGYYSLYNPLLSPNKNLNMTNILNIVYNAFIESVEKRVENTERPIGCLLSGGLDSSLITALVCKLSKSPIETFSIGLKGSEDLKYARMVANHLNTKHHEVIVTEEEFFDAIPEVIKAIGSYDTTTVRASVGNYLIGKYIKKNTKCKVIFNGDGSDELAGGYMYFHECPNSILFDNECKKLLSNIHHFDVLRSDRSISCHGLETRTPFLDYRLVCTYLSIDRKTRYETHMNHCEKYIFRKCIDVLDPKLLPLEVLWRTKEAFSDGVSGQDKSWFEVIQEKVSKLDDDNLKNFNNETYNSPKTKEQEYYRKIFDGHFNNMETIIPYFWMPNFVKANDASARTLSVYKKKSLLKSENSSNNNLNTVDLNEVI